MLTAQSATFIIMQTEKELFLTLDYILLLFKYHIDILSSSETLSFMIIFKSIKKMYSLRKKIIPKMTKKKRSDFQKKIG